MGFFCKSDDDPSGFLLQQQVCPSACFDLVFNLIVRQHSHIWEVETEQIHMETSVLPLDIQEKVLPFPSSHSDLETWEELKQKIKKPQFLHIKYSLFFKNWYKLGLVLLKIFLVFLYFLLYFWIVFYYVSHGF